MELIEVVGLPLDYYVEANKARNRFILVFLDFDQKIKIREFVKIPSLEECLEAIAKSGK
jgi:hypothetical protein